MSENARAGVVAQIPPGAGVHSHTGSFRECNCGRISGYVNKEWRWFRNARCPPAHKLGCFPASKKRVYNRIFTQVKEPRLRPCLQHGRVLFECSTTTFTTSLAKQQQL